MLALSLFGCGDDELASIITPVNEVHFQGGGMVDMLFVVDSSGSMGEEQAALAEIALVQDVIGRRRVARIASLKGAGIGCLRRSSRSISTSMCSTDTNGSVRRR